MSKNIEIKIYSPDSFSACCDLYIRVFNAPPWNDTWTVETTQRCLRDLANNRRFIGFTLWENNILVGAVFAHEKTFYKGEEICIDELFVAPDCRRKGYGLKLMSEIENFGRENGITVITLLTAKNQPAFAFYEMQGYRHLDYMTFISTPTVMTGTSSRKSTSNKVSGTQLRHLLICVIMRKQVPSFICSPLLYVPA